MLCAQLLCAFTAQCLDIRAHQNTLQNLSKHISTRTGSRSPCQTEGDCCKELHLALKKSTFSHVPVKQLTCGECHMLQGTSFQASPWNNPKSARGFRVNSEERRNDASPCNAATSGVPDSIFYFPFLPWPMPCSPGSISHTLRHGGMKRRGNHRRGHSCLPILYERHHCSKPCLNWDLISSATWGKQSSHWCRWLWADESYLHFCATPFPNPVPVSTKSRDGRVMQSTKQLGTAAPSFIRKKETEA